GRPPAARNATAPCAHRHAGRPRPRLTSRRNGADARSARPEEAVLMRSFARALGALVLLCAAPAGAVPLVLGDNVLPGTTAADRPELVGTVIADRFVDYAFA